MSDILPPPSKPAVLPSFWLAWVVVPILIGPAVFVAALSLQCLRLSHCTVSFNSVAGVSQTIYGYGIVPSLCVGIPLTLWLSRRGLSFEAHGAAGLLAGLAAGAALSPAIGRDSDWGFITMIYAAPTGAVTGLVWSLLWRGVAGMAGPARDADTANWRLAAAVVATICAVWALEKMQPWLLQAIMRPPMHLQGAGVTLVPALLGTISASGVLLAGLLPAMAWWNAGRLRLWTGNGAVAGLLAGSTSIAASDMRSLTTYSAIAITLLGCTLLGILVAFAAHIVWRALLRVALTARPPHAQSSPS